MRKVLVIGAGKIGSTIADMLSGSQDYAVTIADHAAQFYEHKFGIGLDRLVGAVGPVTIIVVSMVIGALIVSIMGALLSITELAT